MYKNEKIFVAGHTGLLGRALLQKLRQNGYVNIVTRTHSNLDLTDKKMVDEFVGTEKPSVIFLAAAKVGGILGNKTYPADFLHSNCSIQDNVFEAVRNYDVDLLVFYGSSCTYPKDSSQPIKEEYLLTGPIEETSEGYAAAKIAGIIGCRSYNKQLDSNRFLALVPNSMYGPYDNFDLQNSHVLSSLIRRFHEAKIKKSKYIELWGSGTPRREFISSEDVAEASIFAIENSSKMDNRHYNIGTGSDISIKELAEKISEIVGYEGEIIWDTSKPDGAMRKLLDSSDFMKLGWSPSIQLDSGLLKTYEWYKNEIE